MRKFVIVLAVLALVAGTAHAAALNDGLTRDVFAQNQGRTVATDSSVAIKVWADAGVLSYPGVGVSTNTASANVLKIYTDYTTGTGITINPQGASLDTIGEIVDYINTNFASDSSIRIRAEVGRDARRSSASKLLDAADIIACGSTDINTTALVNLQSDNIISAGAEGEPNKINRLKSFDCVLPLAGVTTYTVYDGDTAVWTKRVSQAQNADTSNIISSGNTITFPDAKGISSKTGNSIMVEASSSTSGANTTAAEKLLYGISIVYDQF